MIPELGHLSLILALCMALVMSFFPLVGAWRGDRQWMSLARPAAWGQFAFLVFAFACLAWAFLHDDFSVAYVASNSNSALPWYYKFSAVWGAHEGSLLLWALILGGWTFAVSIFSRELPEPMLARVLAVMGMISTGFLLFLIITSNPFSRLLPQAPADGNDLNPLLQDPGLIIHPPMLYMGYVGFSVAFAFAIAALLGGRLDAAWARWSRPWTLVAWTFLGIGIVLGSWWAYYELGWGGWWFWDPVENASFMPWLVGTALLHSAIVTEKRGALAGWTLFLAITGFGFSMLGAFLVRSGVLTSVHAFAVDPTRGVLLLTIFLIAAGGGFALFAWRAPKLAGGGVFAPVSREGALVLNNLFLSAAAGTVLLGTLYPLIREAMTGEPISVGPPFFNLTFAPLMAACLLVLPVGPLLTWKRADALGALQRLWAAGLLAVVAGVAVFALNRPASAFSAAGFALGAWLVAGALVEIGERGRLGRAPLAEVGRRLSALPGGAWGMTLAHLGLGLFVLGACFESAWKVEAAQSLGIGGQARLGAYQLSLDDVRPADGPNYAAERASITVTRGGRTACTAGPERRLYYAGGQATSEVAICQKGLDDLYLVLGERRPGPAGAPQWVVRAYYNPLARLIFFGPIIMALGGLISLSDRRLRFALPRRAAAAAVATGPAE